MSPIYIGWPEGIYLALNFIGLGISIAQHGKSETGTESVWTALLWWVLIILPLLYWGGFFS
jgi:hypothetical protein